MIEGIQLETGRFAQTYSSQQRHNDTLWFNSKILQLTIEPHGATTELLKIRLFRFKNQTYSSNRDRIVTCSSIVDSSIYR